MGNSIINKSVSTEEQNKFQDIRTKSSVKTKKRRKKQTKSKQNYIFGKYFSSLFNGSILRWINWQKNWTFILLLFVLFILLIYSNLSYKSKIVRIDKLNEQIIIVKDEMMNMKEDFYNVDYSVEKALNESAVNEGFNLGGYIPFVIQPIEKTKTK